MGSVGTNRLLVHIMWAGLLLHIFTQRLPAQVIVAHGVASGVAPSVAAANSSSASAADPATDQPAPKAYDPTPHHRSIFTLVPDVEDTSDTIAARRPLTVRQKYILSLHQAFDVSSHIGNALEAAAQQAVDGQPHYGQGWGAYGKRFAASEGDQITGSILVYGFLPSALHEDPRYFRRGKGSTISRLWYASNRTLVTRKDNGASGFNFSETVGQLISCGISTTYYPQQDRTASRVFSNWGVNLGANSAYNVLLEFYPDVMRGIFHRHPKPVVESATTGN
jgi:hypothetical protein